MFALAATCAIWALMLRPATGKRRNEFESWRQRTALRIMLSICIAALACYDLRNAASGADVATGLIELYLASLWPYRTVRCLRGIQWVR
jgi:hypothetical protein